MKTDNKIKLFEVPRDSRIRVTLEESDLPVGYRLPEPIEMELNFSRIDGMYSYCTDDDGNVIHVKAWKEVEVL